MTDTILLIGPPYGRDMSMFLAALSWGALFDTLLIAGERRLPRLTNH